MPAKPVVVECIYNAPVNMLWKAISNKDQMREWYFSIEDFRPEVGFQFQFEGGSEEKIYIHLCEVLEVITNSKLTYSWRYSGYEGISFVTFELFNEGIKTRLRLTHKGIETFPANNPDFDKKNFMAGWNEILGSSLRKYVEKSPV